ncbi:double zinc ribbon domain-containing protein [Halobellus rufus]|uniref:double zinc ribbon domain-containing protein n=1 Tax=Halobellus rufus TaxID=1448860 RepID=UPI0006790CB6|nr:zinc ribbon domain-containing protein [Halobellus rufus]
MSAHCAICDKDVDPDPNSIACPDCGSPIPELRERRAEEASPKDPRQQGSPEQGSADGTPEQQSADASQRDSPARDPRQKRDASSPSAGSESGADAADGSQCPECGADVDPSFKFCPQCTEPLSGDDGGADPITTCPECGYDDLTGDEKFCPMCTNDLQTADAGVGAGDGAEDAAGDAADSPADGRGGGSEPADPRGPVHSPGSGGSEVELQFDHGGALTATDETILGREIRKHLHGEGVDAREAKRVSRQHLLFKRTDPGFVVVDLESSNGTELNGEELAANEEYQIEDGDALDIAGVTTATVRIR